MHTMQLFNRAALRYLAPACVVHTAHTSVILGHNAPLATAPQANHKQQQQCASGRASCTGNRQLPGTPGVDHQHCKVGNAQL
mmetsp:Transcript_25040/g.63487  ORF Transcript_25040/g.63487 Transcript_25040/m.63487 type:complete len:82 (+) Transcript_25040:83-328(+)